MCTMSALVLEGLGSQRACSLASFLDYREQEKKNVDLSSVNHTGFLLEYETLELRVHPARVEISNDSDEHCTVVTIDSANRPGTLVEVRVSFSPFLAICRVHTGYDWSCKHFLLCRLFSTSQSWV